MERCIMYIIVFVLGAAFGICWSNLMIFIGQIKKHGLTESLMIDVLHELASIIFILALLYATTIGIVHS